MVLGLQPDKGGPLKISHTFRFLRDRSLLSPGLWLMRRTSIYDFSIFFFSLLSENQRICARQTSGTRATTFTESAELHVGATK